MKIKIIIILCLMLLPVNLMSAEPTKAFDKIVVLYPAVSPILVELGITKQVVGTTKSDDVFKDAIKVGTHIKPNIELLNALSPDLIIAGSKLTFPDELRQRVNAEVYYYDPNTLNEILDNIKELGKLLNRHTQATKLTDKLKAQLLEIKPLDKKVSVIYEVTENPLRTAGTESIITNIIEAAGGINLVKVDKKHVPLSIEQVLELNPDFYIYQVGPMNKNPQNPQERYQYKTLKSKFIKVDEFDFARPGISSFESVLKLNKTFNEKR